MTKGKWKNSPNRMTTLIADRVADRVAERLHEQQDAQLQQRPTSDAHAGSSKPKTLDQPPVVVDGQEFVARAILSGFVHLGAALTSVFGGGWIAAILVSGQQRDAAKAAADPAAREVLEASADAFANLVPTLGNTAIGCFVVLALVLALQAWHGYTVAKRQSDHRNASRLL